MKLSTKLTLMMGAILVAFCGFGLFNLFQMSGINGQTDLLAERYIPIVVNSQRMNTISSDFRIAEIRHIYSEDSPTMANYEKIMDELRGQFNEAGDICAALIISSESKAQFEKVMDGWDKYYDNHKNLLALSQENRTAEAIAQLDLSRDYYDELSLNILRFGTMVTDSADFAKKEGDDSYFVARMLSAILLFVITLIGMFLTIYIVKGVMRQLGKDPGDLAEIAKRVTNGDYAISDGSPVIGVYGNIVDMVKSLEEQIDNARKESDRAASESENAKNATLEAQKALDEAQAKTETILHAADQLEKVAQIVSSATTQLSAQIEQSGRGAEQQAAMAGETATAMEEMNATGMEVARSASSASDMSAKTRLKAEEGSVVVSKSVHSVQQVQKESLELKDSMEQLSQHAQSINQIMSVISDIADQTNLLALNAAIEAARAGEAGRGFAVVADEVRKLAEKTMSSTTDVGNAIKAIQESATKSMAQVDSAVGMIEKTTVYAEESGKVLQEIVDMADQTAGQVAGIATASEEQSAASEEISNSIAQVNTIASETAQAMEEASHAVSDLAQQAQGLTKLIEAMKKG